jgi:NFU1 iron-sulfur cluster scaffold homolog, mitochondrial
MSLTFVPQPTPNPNAYRFVAGRTIQPGGPRSYLNAEQAGDNEAARELFRIPGVVGVMILGDFCTVSQDGSQAWSELIPKIQTVLTQVYG